MVENAFEPGGKINNDASKTAVPDWSEYVLPPGKTYSPADVRKVKPMPYENPVEKIDPTAKEYRDWYKRVSPLLDEGHKGYLSFGDIFHDDKLRGRDEAMLIVAEKHGTEFGSTGFSTRLTPDGVHSLAYRKPEELRKIKEETETATKLVKVVDWIRDHKDGLPQQNGIVSYSNIEAASHSAKFADAESQRMLHFLQAEFSAVSVLRGGPEKNLPSTGIPTNEHELRDMVLKTSSASSAGTQYTDKYTMGAGLAGLYLGRAVGVAVGHQWLGMAAGAYAGMLAGGSVGAFNYYVLKRRPYSQFTKDLDAAVGAD